MGKIKILPPHEAQKIAAGEVVDRPANVVKELIENSLDAGASHLILSCHDGGKKSITIIDNGCGMSPEDARLAILNHATSKLQSVDDLQAISTFGFRGEALASVAAVSHMTLTTKTAEAVEGIQLTLEAGTMVAEQASACNTGTSLEIKDLFYNLPARKKFLKKEETEWHAIYHMLQALCLAHRKCTFTVHHNDHLVLHAPAANTLQERIAQIFDAQLATLMIPCTTQSKDGSCSVTGIVSHPTHHRYDRNQIFLFVNNRWVKNHKLGQALIKAYASILPARRYPSAALFITIDPLLVDINIHPRKEEVQFLHPRLVEEAVEQMVHAALQAKTSQDLGKKAHVPHHASPFAQQTSAPQPFQSKNNSGSTPFAFATPQKSSTNTWSFGAKKETPPQPHVLTTNYNPPDQEIDLPSLSEENSIQNSIYTAPESALQDHFEYQLIGQVHTTYIIIETAEGIVLIDQHAAHERILYELFAQRFTNVATTQLMFPHLITLTPHEGSLITPWLPLFTDHGIVLEPLNEHQFMLKAIPVTLKNVVIEELLKTTLNLVQENNTLNQTELSTLLHDQLRAMMACKAAIKAGDVLDEQQMHELIRKLHATENRMTCPHGRPTTWKLSVNDIERKFKRVE